MLLKTKNAAQSEPTEKIELTREAKILLIEASEDSHGIIIRVPSREGTQIFANQKIFNKKDDPEELARLDSAIKELFDFGYLEPVEDGDLAFRITPEGNQAAGQIES